MRHAAIFRTAMLLALAALGVSAATAQTEFSFAAPGLGEGDEVYLMGYNPLSDQALNEQIPALQARGVRVSY